MLKTLQQQVCLLLLLKKTTNKHINIYKRNFINSCFKTFTVVYRGVFNRASACQIPFTRNPNFGESIRALSLLNMPLVADQFLGSTITHQCIVMSFFVKKKKKLCDDKMR